MINQNGTLQSLANYLNVVPGVQHIGIEDLTPRLAVRPQAEMFTFTFKYRGNDRTIAVVAQPGCSRAEVEDAAAKAAETWIATLNEEEYKRPPTPDEKKQIGRIIGDFRKQAAKRRDSSAGRLYYPGLH